MTSLINISSIVSHGKNSIDVNIPNPLLFSICTPTDLTTNNVSCLIEVTNDLHCSIKRHPDTMRRTEAPDTNHIKRIAQTNVKHKLTLKCFSLRNAKFMMMTLDRFELVFSSNVNCIPLAFLKNTSVVSDCVRKLDDINDDLFIFSIIY